MTYKRNKDAKVRPPRPNPSQANRPKWLKVPESLIDIWRVSTFRTGRWTLVCHVTSEDQAYIEAAKLVNGKPFWSEQDARIEHKAGLRIGDKLYLVNVLPIKVLPPLVPKPISSENENPPS